MYTKDLPKLDRFIFTGEGTESSAILNIARTVARRVERKIITLKKTEEIDPIILKYINRLSDYLFTVARLITQRDVKKEVRWIPIRAKTSSKKNLFGYFSDSYSSFISDFISPKKKKKMKHRTIKTHPNSRLEIKKLSDKKKEEMEKHERE